VSKECDPQWPLAPRTPSSLEATAATPRPWKERRKEIEYQLNPRNGYVFTELARDTIRDALAEIDRHELERKQNVYLIGQLAEFVENRFEGLRREQLPASVQELLREADEAIEHVKA
jgi:hypothetical protein